MDIHVFIKELNIFRWRHKVLMKPSRAKLIAHKTNQCSAVPILCTNLHSDMNGIWALEPAAFVVIANGSLCTDLLRITMQKTRKLRRLCKKLINACFWIIRAGPVLYLYHAYITSMSYYYTIISTILSHTNYMLASLLFHHEFRVFMTQTHLFWHAWRIQFFWNAGLRLNELNICHDMSNKIQVVEDLS